MRVIRTKIYRRKSNKLLNEAERHGAEQEVLDNPEKWPVVPGTGGVRKARAGRGASGKSGGVRILYYVWLSEYALFFMDIYAKNQQENISDAEKAVLKSVVQQFKEEFDG